MERLGDARTPVREPPRDDEWKASGSPSRSARHSSRGRAVNNNAPAVGAPRPIEELQIRCRGVLPCPCCGHHARRGDRARRWNVTDAQIAELERRGRRRARSLAVRRRRAREAGVRWPVRDTRGLVVQARRPLLRQGDRSGLRPKLTRFVDDARILLDARQHHHRARHRGPVIGRRNLRLEVAPRVMRRGHAVPPSPNKRTGSPIGHPSVTHRSPPQAVRAVREPRARLRLPD